MISTKKMDTSHPIHCANLGTSRDHQPMPRYVPKSTIPVGVSRPLPKYPPRPGTSYQTMSARQSGPLMIHGKRWYFRLVTSQEGEYKRARALMDDYDLNQIAQHTVICFTPNRIPGRDRPFRNKEGNPIRIYAFFESYVEFFRYFQEFEPADRSFYEIIFGELPQKPHFDIDIDADNFNQSYPNESWDLGAETLRTALIQACIDVLTSLKMPFNLQRDLLLYTSHGPTKRSFHLVLNNICHDGNREARAFYDAVVAQIRILTQNKYAEFVDRGVYSSRQQFRMVGSQKVGSGRPKVFHAQFEFKGQVYEHIYTETTTDPEIQGLIITYESMVSFISGCSFIPSLVPPRPYGGTNLSELPDLDRTVVSQCLTMLQEKMNPCPFTVIGIKGHVISLHRLRPSHCPLCLRQHEHENPRMYLSNGKIFWDCRRNDDPTKKFMVGYLALNMDDLQHWNDEGSALDSGSTSLLESGSDDDGDFMFGDFNLGPPTLPPSKSSRQKSPPPPDSVGTSALAPTPVPTSTLHPVPTSTPHSLPHSLPTSLPTSTPHPLPTSTPHSTPTSMRLRQPATVAPAAVPLPFAPPLEQRRTDVVGAVRKLVIQKERRFYERQKPIPHSLSTVKGRWNPGPP